MTDLVVSPAPDVLLNVGVDQIDLVVVPTQDVVLTVEPSGPPGPTGSQGPQGAPGAIGPTGPAGPAAIEATFAYVHHQLLPSALWVIHHNLNGYPNIVALNSANDQILGGIVWTDANSITIDMGGREQSGIAYLS